LLCSLQLGRGREVDGVILRSMFLAVYRHQLLWTEELDSQLGSPGRLSGSISQQHPLGLNVITRFSLIPRLPSQYKLRRLGWRLWRLRGLVCFGIRFSYLVKFMNGVRHR
jgi:hypothetical protein